MGDPNRRAARCLVIDEAGRVLVLRGNDPHDPHLPGWWFTPGGGLDDGESPERAVCREVAEEVGIVVDPDDVGDVVATRRARFEFRGRWFDQHEDYFAVRVPIGTAVTTSGRTDLEAEIIVDHAWLDADGLQALDEAYYPTDLDELVREVLAARPTRVIEPGSR